MSKSSRESLEMREFRAREVRNAATFRWGYEDRMKVQWLRAIFAIMVSSSLDIFSVSTDLRIWIDRRMVSRFSGRIRKREW